MPKPRHIDCYSAQHTTDCERVLATLLRGLALAFRRQVDGKHAATVRSALEVLRLRFVDEPGTEGYLKDGPVAVARFELGNEADQRDRRVLRQLEASDIVGRLLRGVGPVR